MFKIYIALQNADLNEGRGPMIPKGYFKSEQDAEDFLSILTGVQGIKGAGLEIREATVYEELDEHPEWNNSRLRDIALSKLTDNEKRVLGLL